MLKLIHGILLLHLIQKYHSDLTSLVHPDIDSSPIAAVIVIGEDVQRNVAYVANNVTVKVGQEILIAYNDTDTQSVTNGMSRDDPLAGRLFATGQFLQESLQNM
jgi:hypothetical protein